MQREDAIFRLLFATGLYSQQAFIRDTVVYIVGHKEERACAHMYACVLVCVCVRMLVLPVLPHTLFDILVHSKKHGAHVHRKAYMFGHVRVGACTCMRFTLHSELRAYPSYGYPPRRRCPDKGGLSVHCMFRGSTIPAQYSATQCQHHRTPCMLHVHHTFSGCTYCVQPGPHEHHAFSGCTYSIRPSESSPKSTCTITVRAAWHWATLVTA